MNRAGNCHDNAVAESFFGNLQAEVFYDEPVSETRSEARARVHDYVHLF